MTPDEQEQYQAMFDTFVYARGLDLEYDNWSKADQADWDKQVSRFMANLQSAK